MTTAISIAIVLLGIAGGYGYWACQAIAAGAAAWPYVLGAFALPFAIPFVASLAWFTLAAWFGSPGRPKRASPCASGCCCSGTRCVAIAAFRSAHDLLPLAAARSRRPRRPRPAGAAAARRAVQRRRLAADCAAYLAARGIGPVYALSYGPPLASIECFADQTAAKIDAILRGDRRERRS